MKTRLYVHLLAAFSFTLVGQGVYAATCPTVVALSHFSKHGWQLLDSEDNQPLSQARTRQFQQEAYQFVLAEWVAASISRPTSRSTKQGEIHCYYRDKAGSMFDAYLSKKEVIPVKAVHHWYTVTGAFDCTAGVGLCRFPGYFSKEGQKVA